MLGGVRKDIESHGGPGEEEAWGMCQTLTTEGMILFCFLLNHKHLLQKLEHFSCICLCDS